MAVLHADIERLIAAAGLESTIIRPGMFASNTLFWWAPAIRADGVVRWPYGAAETAPVDDRDVSQAEQVSIIGDVVGRRTRFEELSPDEFRGETAGTWPRPVVDMLLDAWAATMGRPAFVTTTVQDILGLAAVPPVGRRSRHRVYGRGRVRLGRSSATRRVRLVRWRTADSGWLTPFVT
jgi:uncharacterized protein YbjT (DUF2867 family)